MRLELVPIDGEKPQSEDDQQKQSKRTCPIPPETIQYFTEDQQLEIKYFLARLVVAAEQLHHLMEQKKQSVDEDQKDYLELLLSKSTERRNALFENPPYFLRYFIKLLELCPTEPWKELEEFLKNIREEDIAHYRQTSQSLGIEAALDNTYLLQIEDDSDEQYIDSNLKSRLTPKEIEELLLYHPLESLVNHLINARRVSSGEFWDKGFYDL